MILGAAWVLLLDGLSKSLIESQVRRNSYVARTSRRRFTRRQLEKKRQRGQIYLILTSLYHVPFSYTILHSSAPSALLFGHRRPSLFYSSSGSLFTRISILTEKTPEAARIFGANLRSLSARSLTLRKPPPFYPRPSAASPLPQCSSCFPVRPFPYP